MSIFYEFNNYKDLFLKCKREIIQLKKKIDSDILFNMICTLNHLFEWFLEDTNIDEQSKIEAINKFNSYPTISNLNSQFNAIYKKRSTFPSLNIEQYLIRCLCNNAKHFKLILNTRIKKINGAYYGSSTYYGSVYYGQKSQIKYIVEYDNKEYDVRKIIEDSIMNWESFLMTKRLL
jgi:hypothetical protein